VAGHLRSLRSVSWGNRLTRREKILLLAGSLHDLLSGPKGMSLRATGKAAASHYEPCLACGGAWGVGAKTGRKHAYRSGNGWRLDQFTDETGKQHAGSGRVGMDAMTGKPVGTAENTLAAKKTVSWVCNFCHGTGVHKKVRCGPCEGTGRREHSPFVLSGVSDTETLRNDPTLTLELAIERRDQAGSYHELELCLAEMRRKSPHRHRVFYAIHVAKTRAKAALTADEGRWLAEAMTFLETTMPTEVRVPGAIIEASRRDLSANQRFAKGKSSPQKWREARDVEIRERFANGETAGLIAEALGLSRSRVNEILYRERVA
jgi:hypothetical protein